MTIIDEIKKIDSGPKKLKEFGFVVGGVLLALGLFAWWRGKSFYTVLVGISIFLIFFGFVAPKVLKPFQKAWMTLAILLGWVMSRVILAILFYGAVTPMSLLTRAFGKDFLDMKFRDGRTTYWRKRSLESKSKADFEKQF